MSLLSFLFCCLRPRSLASSDEPNENSRLIPASEDVPPAARHVIIDQQRMKERLGVIVRAKEGKMVNVNASLPFNLNNNTTHRPHHHHAQPQPPQQQQSRLDRVRARASSPQPSFDTERQSVLSSASASASPSQEIDEETTRRPALNVRIVRPGSALARGRPITRDVVPSSELQQQQQQEGYGPGAGAEGAGSDGPAGGSGGEQDGTVATGAIASASTQGTAQIPSTVFTIQNVGSLSRSWGD
ncbi:hypothetical protein BJY52DRAFT_1188468 [Lactarius psammicola]|nr:hypothetical protein BJY52DRAFT_1188468 [Lactarius psammicola]